MNAKYLEEQKKLMGLTEDDLFSSQPVPYMVNKKIDELKSKAGATKHTLEIATRGISKLYQRLYEIERKALVSGEALKEEGKVLMNLVRINLDQIDKAQDLSNDLLKSLDYIIGGDF